MLTYSTRSQPAHRKLSYWNEVISETFTPLETHSPNRERFEAELHCVPIGHFGLSKIRSLPAKVESASRHVALGRTQHFYLHMQLQGRLQVMQDGRSALLQEGDIAIADSSRPYTLEYDAPCTTLVLTTPAKALKRHLPNPEQIVGQRLRGDSGYSHTASVMLSSLWQQTHEPMNADIASRITENLLDVVAACWLSHNTVRVEESAVCGARRIQILRYVEAHLSDPDLGARRVAGAFGISPRYLHMLFSGEGETISHYILRRRLEHCARQLGDPLFRKRTITEIAFSWGFNNATHFARVFRDHFRLTPREYRAQQQAEATAAP